MKYFVITCALLFSTITASDNSKRANDMHIKALKYHYGLLCDKALTGDLTAACAVYYFVDAPSRKDIRANMRDNKILYRALRKHTLARKVENVNYMRVPKSAYQDLVAIANNKMNNSFYTVFKGAILQECRKLEEKAKNNNITAAEMQNIYYGLLDNLNMSEEQCDKRAYKRLRATGLCCLYSMRFAKQMLENNEFLVLDKPELR